MTPEQLSLLSEQDRELWELCNPPAASNPWARRLEESTLRLLERQAELLEREAKHAETLGMMNADLEHSWACNQEVKEELEAAESRIAELEKRVVSLEEKLRVYER